MSDPKPLSQFFAIGERPGRQRRPLDELGDLFFSRGSSQDHDDDPPPLADELLAPPGLDDLLAHSTADDDPVEDPSPAADESDIEVIALLAGGLPLEARDRLARLAACRLAAVERDAPQPPVVTFRGGVATVSTLSGMAPAGDPVLSLQSRASEAGRMVLVVAEHVGSFLEAGRQLPDHCVTLATPDAESLVEAYRELKVATAATVGPVPEIYVLDAADQAQAEQTYRRLARVAIAHLGSTPTFAGAALETHDRPADACRHVAAQSAGAAADRVYRAVAPLIGAEAAPTGNRETVAADPAAAPPVAVEVRPAEDDRGRRETAPPVAGVVNRRPAPQPPEPTPQAAPAATVPQVFTTWQPTSPAEVLTAVRNSIAALLPGSRGIVEAGDVVRAAEMPDLLAADDAGRPVAVLVADGRSTDVLRRAVESRQWVTTYAPLVARAFPKAGLDAESGEVRTIVLAPEAAAAALEPLCPSHVALVAWTPVAFGEHRGLLFRQALWPLGGTSAPLAAASFVPQASSLVAEPLAASPPVARRSVIETADEPTDADDAFDPGTSPDDDLSADEINDLAGPFELDELT